jgi:hypothetical protein
MDEIWSGLDLPDSMLATREVISCPSEYRNAHEYRGAYGLFGSYSWMTISAKGDTQMRQVATSPSTLYIVHGSISTGILSESAIMMRCWKCLMLGHEVRHDHSRCGVRGDS